MNLTYISYDKLPNIITMYLNNYVKRHVLAQKRLCWKSLPCSFSYCLLMVFMHNRIKSFKILLHLSLSVADRLMHQAAVLKAPCSNPTSDKDFLVCFNVFLYLTFFCLKSLYLLLYKSMGISCAILFLSIITHCNVLNNYQVIEI